MDAWPTRDRLLDAAEKVFMEHGYTAASMDQVRHVAGVSNGSLYHHYPTKAQLADAVYAHALRDLHGFLLARIGDRVGARAGVEGLIRAYVQWVVKHPGRARLLHKMGRMSAMSDASDERNAANAQAFGALQRWFESRVESGELRAMPFQVWIALVFAPAMSLTGQWVSAARPAVPATVRGALERGAWMAVAP